MRVCARPGCDVSLEGAHKGRKWCSERCRRIALYSGTCEVCGGPTDGSNGRDSAPRHCAKCAVPLMIERQRARYAPIREKVERLWREGYTARQIAAEMGWSPRNGHRYIANCRRRGYDLPYRYHISEGGRAAMRASMNKVREAGRVA